MIEKGKVAEQPWTVDAAPIEITARAKRIPEKKRKITMKLAKQLALAISALVLGAASAVLAAPVYDTVTEFQWLPIVHSDTNAISFVRSGTDCTKPIHGPWLLNPAPDSITINFITRRKTGAGLEIREKGTEDFKRIWKKSYDIIDYSSDTHNFHIGDLKTGTEYEYRLLSVDSVFTRCFAGNINVGRELYSFKTLDPKRDSYKVWFTADTHGCTRLKLDRHFKIAEGAECDFFIFNGDNVEDGFYEGRYDVMHGFLDDAVRLWATSKPSVFVRGNHDCYEKDAWMWRDFFPRKDGRAYFCVSQGPALFLFLDTCTFVGSKVDVAIAKDFRQEQAAWIDDLKNTDEWKKSKFRVVFSHISTHQCQWPTEMSDFWAALNETDPARRIHIYLGGHMHRHLRIEPGTELSKSIAPKWLGGGTNEFHYPLVQIKEQTAGQIAVSPEKLTFKFFTDEIAADGTPVIQDQFDLFPDGTLK